MGNTQKPNFKKYEIYVKKRLLKIIEDKINKEKKENQINNLINQNINKMNKSNFSKNFHEQPYETIYSIINLIYVNNTNSILNNSLYETMFNYDINDEKEKGSSKVKERINELIPDFLGDKTENEKIFDEKEKGISKEKERINKSIPDVLDNKSENEKINSNEKVKSDSNKQINENKESSKQNFEKIKKKKHSKNPKQLPVIGINLNLKDIEKAVHLEKIYGEKKKQKDYNSNLKRNLTQININDKRNFDDKNFLKIYDDFIQPNKLEKDKIHNLKKRKIKSKKY